jgi:hypothetical protein
MMEATETIQKVEKKPKKYRAPWEKEGTYKHLQKVLRRIEGKLDDVRRNQRYITKGLDLAGYLVYDQNYVHEVVCTNEIDVMVLEELYSAGEDGRLPKDIAAALNKHFHSRHYQPWHIRYILRRMNRKLKQQQIGEKVAEKRGMQWALTRFGRKAWGLKREEIKADTTSLDVSS